MTSQVTKPSVINSKRFKTRAMRWYRVYHQTRSQSILGDIMAIRKVEPAQVKSDRLYIIKTRGSHSNGSFIKGSEMVDGKLRLRPRILRDVSEIEWIYECPKEGVKVKVVGPKKNKDVWPCWKEEMDKYNGLELTIADMRHNARQEEYYYLHNDGDNKVGFNIRWFEPLEVPEFQEQRHKYLFRPVEVVLPKKPLAFAEIKVLANADVAEAIEELQKEIAGGDLSTATFAVVFDNKPINYWKRQACHGSLSDSSNRGASYIISCINKKPDIDQQIYLQYLVNESPYSSAFVMKNVGWITDSRVHILTTDVPSNILAGACIASRVMWEWKGVAKAFADLVRQGVPQSLAFVIAMKARPENAKLEKLTFGLSSHPHIPLNVGSMGDKGIIAFMRNEPSGLNDHYRDNVHYRGIEDMFNRRGKSDLYEALKDIGCAGGQWDKTPIEWHEAIAQATTIALDFVSENGEQL